MRYFILFTLSIFLFSTSAIALPDEPYISVTGSASLAVKADQVVIQFQPSAMNKSGEVAKQELNQKVSLLIENLNNAGFIAQNIESISQSTRPEYEYQKNKRTLVGVRTTHKMRYRLTEIEKVNSFIDALLAANVKAISALQYGLQDPLRWQEKMRKAAVLDSQQKAANLAQLYDAKLGHIYSITYSNDRARPALMRSVAMDSEELAVTPQNITLSDRVETVFILEP